MDPSIYDVVFRSYEQYCSTQMAGHRQRGKKTIDLPVEIILQIIEALGWDPGALGSFMRTSKTSASILMTHKSPLTKYFIRGIGSNLGVQTHNLLLSTAPTPRSYIDPRPVDTVVHGLIRHHFFNRFGQRPTIFIPPDVPPTLEEFTTAFKDTMKQLHPTVTLTPPMEIPVQQAHHRAMAAIHSYAKDSNTGHRYGRANPLPSPPRMDYRPAAKLATPVTPGLFSWVGEVHLRRTIENHLPHSPLFDLKRPEILPIFHTQLKLCHCCHSEAHVVYKVRGLQLLYQMWDSRMLDGCLVVEGRVVVERRCPEEVCNPQSECRARANVERWILSQSVEDLACVLQCIWIASQLYDYKPRSAKAMGTCEHNGHQNGSGFTTRTVAERNKMWDVVERQCIFREMCLECGPYFLYCARPLLEGHSRRDAEQAVWAKVRLDMGVKRMHAYESGAPLEDEEETEASDADSTTAVEDRTPEPNIPRPTLQAVMLGRFCEKRGLQLRHVWNDVFWMAAHQVDDLRKQLKAKKEERERRQEAEKERVLAEKIKRVMEENRRLEEERRASETAREMARGEQARFDALNTRDTAVKEANSDKGKGRNEDGFGDGDGGELGEEKKKKRTSICDASDEEEGECVWDYEMWDVNDHAAWEKAGRE